MKEHKIFAACYDRMLASIEKKVLGRRREALLAGLTGRVLDVGAGTGVNIPFFKSASTVVLAEPDGAMRAKMDAKIPKASVPVETSGAPAEKLPFPDASFDAAVCTLVLCTVQNPEQALSEIHRVLKPGGTLVVLEHVEAPDEAKLHRWQHRIGPVWTKVAAGCVLTRDTATTVEKAGFTFSSLENLRELPGWMPISPMIQGVATRS
ncbi:methyltransferase domain-containing protein [Sporichthya sp.]|uniref:class I SAM-dependent methyltransferase n=1 Tax=Sporichthya sp. TaxID=65475 RepID=UPI0017C488DB|nr:methyltransferase domain-containing protein [Sporichthya sp.]MBA3743764.1 methyltransferase domain-containing protein [Sporichthya sp.]